MPRRPAGRIFPLKETPPRVRSERGELARFEGLVVVPLRAEQGARRVEAAGREPSDARGERVEAGARKRLLLGLRQQRG